MKNIYILEFWYQSETIDTKKSNNIFVIPNIGESIAIMTFENPNMSGDRNWWIVKEIKHAIGKNEHSSVLTQKTMIEIEPDPKNGLWKSDPEYSTFKFN